LLGVCESSAISSTSSRVDGCGCGCGGCGCGCGGGRGCGGGGGGGGGCAGRRASASRERSVMHSLAAPVSVPVAGAAAGAAGAAAGAECCRSKHSRSSRVAASRTRRVRASPSTCALRPASCSEPVSQVQELPALLTLRAHRSPPTAHCPPSMLTASCFLLIAHCLLLPSCLLLPAPLHTHCSLLTVLVARELEVEVEHARPLGRDHLVHVALGGRHRRAGLGERLGRRGQVALGRPAFARLAP
jgi:hypothetical protein